MTAAADYLALLGAGAECRRNLNCCSKRTSRRCACRPSYASTTKWRGSPPRKCAQEGLDCPCYLLRLSELELLDREQRATERRIKAAKFPVVKSLETFELRSIPSLNKSLVLELARTEYLDRRENVLSLGNSGTARLIFRRRWGWRLVRKVIQTESADRR